jgi:calcineurin-like phosphoesterase family protein
MAIRRGFQDELEMNNHIISQWNSVVSKKDVTWILGDITMEKSNYEILDKLNGIKKIVLGNHDEPQHIPELLKYVNSVCGMFKYKHKELGQVFLTHCPIHSSELNHRVSYNIHGHVHENSLDDIRYINVSCEAIDYKPKLLTELIKKNELSNNSNNKE